MTQIGSFIPASEESVIGICDKIITRIESRETVSSNNSSFSRDLLSVSSALQYATPKTLLLFDEFGKGTNPLDCFSLLAAILHHFSKSKIRLLAVTHYHGK